MNAGRPQIPSQRFLAARRFPLLTMSSADLAHRSSVPKAETAAIKFGSTFLLFLLFAGSSIAGETLWTLDAVMTLKSVTDPQITLNGSTVAYVVKSADLKRNTYDSEIWIIRATSGEPYQLLFPHPSDFHPRWSNDGRKLAFLSRRDGITQVYVARALDRIPVKVTESPTDVTDCRWSPDGEYLAYLAADPLTTDEIAKLRSGDDAVVDHQNHRYSRLYLVSSQGGRGRLVTRLDRHVTSFDWAPDSSRIVYAGQTTPRFRHVFHVDLYEVDLISGRELPLVTQAGQDTAPSYSPDGRFVAFYSQGGMSNYFGERYIGLVASGGGRVRYMTNHLDADVFGGGRKFWWSEDGSELTFGAGKGTNYSLYSVNVSDSTARRLVDCLAGTSDFSVSRDGTRISFIKSSKNAPPDLYLRELEGKRAREFRLSNTNPQISDYPIFETQTVQWKSKDGLSIEGVLRLPVGYKHGDRVPLLVDLHGTTGVALEGFPIPRTYPTQLFLQEGFGVLEPNFRGSINYGARFRLAVLQAQGFADVEDISTGIDALVEQGIADSNRLGIMGWSYGGFLCAWMIGHSHRFKAACIGASTTDWISWYGAYYGGKDAPPELMWDFLGGKPWHRWEVYNRHSPRYHLMNVKTPSLLLRGEQDVDSSAEIFQALTDLDVPVTLVSYPREGHGIEEPIHQRDLMNRSLQWFEHWISGK